MAIRLKRPSSDDLRPLLEAGRTAELTYGPVGVSTSGEVPAGFERQHFRRSLGSADAAFDAASGAIRDWQAHKGSGLVVCADGPPAVGSVVAMSAPLPVGYIDVVCRVVSVIDEADRFGFAYGSLPVHAERGEEAFMIERLPGREVSFRIDVVSRPLHPLARLCPPITKRLQRAATVRYLDAMTAAVAGR